MDIKEKLIRIIEEISNKEVDTLVFREDTTLTRDLGFDSINIIQLIVEVEAQFNIEIEDDDLGVENISNFGKLCSIIEKKLALTK
jgi:acyl carrier protein